MSDLADLQDHLSHRPVLVVIAGSNGAGKTTFYDAYLRASGLPFINADQLAKEMALSDRQGAEAADAMRHLFIVRGDSFITETVFSDPVEAKLKQFHDAMTRGFRVVLIFIGISSPERSEMGVAMRVSQGGHDVPPDKIQERFPRTLDNLKKAVRTLSAALIYDNDDLARPFRLVGKTVDGAVTFLDDHPPAWWAAIAHA